MPSHNRNPLKYRSEAIISGLKPWVFQALHPANLSAQARSIYTYRIQLVYIERKSVLPSFSCQTAIARNQSQFVIHLRIFHP